MAKKKKPDFRYKIVARNTTWAVGCTVTESVRSNDPRYRRYTATIDGWQGFLLFDGIVDIKIPMMVAEKVREIRGRIREGDEKVFFEDHRI